MKNFMLDSVIMVVIGCGCFMFGVWAGADTRHQGDGEVVVLIRNSVIEVHKVAVIYGVTEEGGNMAACELLRDDLSEQFGVELSCVYEKALR